MSDDQVIGEIGPPPPTYKAWDDGYPALKGLPDVGDAALKGVQSKVVREYVRAVMIDPALKRLFGIGMGYITVENVVVAGNAVRVVKTEAPATVQRAALSEILRIGVPPKVEGETAPFRGVIVLGEAGLVEARRRNAADRLEVTGPPKQIAEYTPPPGFNVTVIEDDLTGAQVPASPDDAPPPPTSTAPVTTKARELAAKRRSRSRK